MLNIIQNTIGSLARAGFSVIRDGLKMWLPFTKAEPLGENIVVNGDFSDGTTGWVGQNANINVVGGELEVTSTVGYGKSVQNTTTVVGKRYVLSAKVTAGTTIARLEIYSSPTSGVVGQSVSSGTQQVSLSFVAAATTIQVQLKCQSASLGTAYFDNVTVEEYAQETPDTSGNDNNAILKTGKCLTFTGNDSVDTSFPSSKTIKTIAFWIYPTHTSSAEAVFYGGGGTGGTRELRLAGSDSELKSINGNIVMDTYVDGVYSGVTNGGSAAQLELNQWQRVVLTSSTGFSVVNDTFNVGSGLYASDGRFNMSDLQIYGAEFTTDDIAFDYANPQKLVTDNASSSVTLNDLHAWWHMSEGSGTIAFDSAPLIGSDLVVNGDFATDSNWSKTNATILNGIANISTTGDLAGILQSSVTTSGKSYEFTFEITSIETLGQGLSLVSGGLTSAILQTFTSIGKHTIYFTATSTTIAIKRKSGATDISIDNVSIKEVYNVDGKTYDGSSLGATYDDAQERIPQLGMMNWSKGSNLIEYSEYFANSYWSKGAVTLVSDYLAPDGTLSAYKVTADESYSSVYRLFSGIGSYNRSIWAKTTSGTGTVSLLTRFDSTGSIFTITNDWQRFTINSADSLPDYFYAVDFRAGNLDEVILWGAQLEESSSASAYRRTNGTAVTNATLISCATDSQKDILGNAVRVKGNGFNLDGTGYAEVLDDSAFDIPACNGAVGDFTIESWVKAGFVYQASGVNSIFSLGGNISIPGTSGLISMSVNKLGGYVDAAQLKADDTFIMGNWYHVVITRDKNSLCTLYIDSVSQEDTELAGGTITNSNVKQIGRDDGSVRYYHELIDDVKFYNRELSSDEIEQNYKATKSGHNN